MKPPAIVLVLLFAICLCGCGDDGGGGTAGPSNRAPILTEQADTSLAIGDTLVIWAVAHDPDGDDLAYTAAAHITYQELMQGYAPDAGMNTASGRFEFRTRPEDGPQRRFTFSVDDGRGGADSSTFWVHMD